MLRDGGDHPAAPPRPGFWQMLGGAQGAWLLDNPAPTRADLAARFPLAPPDYAALAAPSPDHVQCVWLGHASCLVQMEGVTFLTDPVFSQRASPFQWAGPRRVVGNPLEPEDPGFPALDFVIVSHAHYDHLDAGSVRRLHGRWGDALTWYVPLGLRPWFRRAGVTNVVEMDWWQEARHPGSGVRVVMTPAQHWANRLPVLVNRTLWGSFCVIGERGRFWFSGDTGYCPVFKEIGERYGPFDVAAVPIGAYDPRWFMAPQHCDPAEAVQIHQDVRARVSVPIHWGTFVLTREALDEPPVLLGEALRAAKLTQEEFRPLTHGEMVKVKHAGRRRGAGRG